MRRVFADHFRASTPPVPGRYALWAVIGDAEELLVGRFTVGDANACEREAERLRVRAVEEDARDPDAALQALRRAVLLSPRAPTRRHYVAAVVTHAIALRDRIWLADVLSPNHAQLAASRNRITNRGRHGRRGCRRRPR